MPDEHPEPAARPPRPGPGDRAPVDPPSEPADRPAARPEPPVDPRASADRPAARPEPPVDPAHRPASRLEPPVDPRAAADPWSPPASYPPPGAHHATGGGGSESHELPQATRVHVRVDGAVAASGPPPPPHVRLRQRRRRLVLGVGLAVVLLSVPVGLAIASFQAERDATLQADGDGSAADGSGDADGLPDGDGGTEGAPDGGPAPDGGTGGGGVPGSQGEGGAAPGPEGPVEQVVPPDLSTLAGTDAIFGQLLLDIDASERVMMGFQDDLLEVFAGSLGDRAPEAAMRAAGVRRDELLEVRDRLAVPTPDGRAEDVRLEYLDHLDSWARYMDAVAEDAAVLAPEGRGAGYTLDINATADAFSRALQSELPEDIAAPVREYADAILDRGFRGFGGSADV